MNIPLRATNPFLDKTYVHDGEIATIAEPPYIISAKESRFNKEQTILPIKLKRDNQTYRLTLNSSSNDRLVKAFGHNGDLWVGKDIVLQKRSMDIEGRPRDVLFVSIVNAIEDSL